MTVLILLINLKKVNEFRINVLGLHKIILNYNSSMLLSKSLFIRKKETVPVLKTSFSFHTRSHMLGHEIDVLASFVPDEVIYHNKTGYVNQFETVLMLGDVSGFTNLCEKYSKIGQSGPSCLTDVLNSYIGSMVQEALSYGGDVFKFSGDAFLAIWKPNERQDIREIMKRVVRCAFNIQQTHGQYITNVAVTLRVKLAITAGESLFAIIGNDNMKHYIIAGEPIWNIRRAERNWLSGDILVDPKAWSYARADDYLYKTAIDGHFVKILGVRTECAVDGIYKFSSSCRHSVYISTEKNMEDILLPFMIPPVKKAVLKMEPIDELTEMRQVVIVIVNVITSYLEVKELLHVVDEAYQTVCMIVHKIKGCVNKVSLFDKDLMFVTIFGLTGYKHSFGSQAALKCASDLKQNLIRMVNVTDVSIGVTTGVTYCGVVGHPQRREYTVIGAPVNKAARLMVAYPSKITCDRATFIHSKLEPSYFILQEPKALKGLSTIGPIYEYVEAKRSSNTGMTSMTYPLLGRSAETELAQQLISEFSTRRCGKEVKRRGKYSVLLIEGQPRQGKSRLLEEIIHNANTLARVNSLSVSSQDSKIPYQTIRKIFAFALDFKDNTSSKDKEEKIRQKLGYKSPHLLCCLNKVFGISFEASKFYSNYDVDSKREITKLLVTRLMRAAFADFWVIGIDDCEYIDEESWLLMSAMMSEDIVFFVITLGNQQILKEAGKSVLGNTYVRYLILGGIDKWYHIGVACQMLAVSAIPPDLERALHKWSDGNPGWIESYLLSLLQSGGLVIRNLPVEEYTEMGLISAPLDMLSRVIDRNSTETVFTEPYKMEWKEQSLRHQSRYTLIIKQKTTPVMGKYVKLVSVCMLTPGFIFDENQAEVTADEITVTIIDAMTNSQRLFLKCASVIGETFSRKMVKNILNFSEREMAIVVKQLFDTYIMMCANYSTHGSIPGAFSDFGQSICYCSGLLISDCNRDLPKYASCGHMKFRSKSLRNSAYNLLTDQQKRSYHLKALMYLQKETQRCTACGGGAFECLMAVTETKEEKFVELMREDGSKISDYKEKGSAGFHEINIQSELFANSYLSMSSDCKKSSKKLTEISDDSEDLEDPIFHVKDSHFLTVSETSAAFVRSFASYNFSHCQCMHILDYTFVQLLEHSHEAGLFFKEIELMTEYARVCICSFQISHAMELLEDAMDVICDGCNLLHIIPKKHLRLMEGKILTLMGHCQMEMGQLTDAYQFLQSAMKKFDKSLPSNQLFLKCIYGYELQKLPFVLRHYPQQQKNYGNFHKKRSQQISICFGLLYTVLKSRGRTAEAALAAVRCLKNAVESGLDFGGTCIAFCHALDAALRLNIFETCLQLEQAAVKLCWFNRTYLDTFQLCTIAQLYATIFTSRLARGHIAKASDIGFKAIRICSTVFAVSLKIKLIPNMIEILIRQKNLTEIVNLMHELYFMSSEESDDTGHTWYHGLNLEILLYVGYRLASVKRGIQFLVQQTYASRDIIAERRLYTNLWLWCIRIRDWESSTIWETYAVPQRIVLPEISMENINTSLNLLEGLLISSHAQNPLRPAFKNLQLIKDLVHALHEVVSAMKVTQPRFLHLLAYYNYIKGNVKKANIFLKNAKDIASSQGNILEEDWIQHTQMIWENPVIQKISRGRRRSKLENENFSIDNIQFYSFLP